MSSDADKWAERMIVGVFVAVPAIIVLAMVGLPQYWVYTQRLEGEAILAKSEAQKKVLVEQARAEMEAARLRAEAISIVGEAAQRFPEYRTQEFIGAFAEALKEGNVQQIIYVPTEANIPIVERGRRGE